MKKALSLLLSAVMLLTVIGSTLTLSVSAATSETVNFLDTAFIAEGAENIAVNSDGSWTVTGPFALAPNVTFEYDVLEYITLDMTTDTPLDITLFDRDPNGVYNDHYITLYQEWVGYSRYFPVGTFNETNTLGGIYTWNVHSGIWGNDGLATVRAIYFEFEKDNGSATIRTFNLNRGDNIGSDTLYEFDEEPA